MRDHVDSALTSCCSRVSRVGLVLINQFFKRNNVGRVLFPLFFLFYYYFFFLSLDVIVRRTWFSTRFHFGIYFSLSLFCCWFLLEMWRRKKKVRFKYSNRWSIVLWLGSVFNEQQRFQRIESGRDWREGFYLNTGGGEAYEVLWENKQMSGLIRTKLRLKTRECFMRWCGKLSLLSWCKLVKPSICRLSSLGLKLWY